MRVCVQFYTYASLGLWFDTDSILSLWFYADASLGIYGSMHMPVKAYMVLNTDASLGLWFYTNASLGLYGFKYIILCKSRCMVLCRCSLGLCFMQMQVYIYVGLYGFIHRCMFRPMVLYISSLGL